MGTVAYMSPEQVRGEDLDGRSDIFSFGLVLYEMATGVPAFSGNTSGVIHEAILNRFPISPLRLNPELPPKLEEIISKALEKDPDMRYHNASDLRTDLKRLKRDTDSGRSASRMPGGRAQRIHARPARPSVGSDANCGGSPPPRIDGVERICGGRTSRVDPARPRLRPVVRAWSHRLHSRLNHRSAGHSVASTSAQRRRRQVLDSRRCGFAGYRV